LRDFKRFNSLRERKKENEKGRKQWKRERDNGRYFYERYFYQNVLYFTLKNMEQLKVERGEREEEKLYREG